MLTRSRAAHQRLALAQARVLLLDYFLNISELLKKVCAAGMLRVLTVELRERILDGLTKGVTTVRLFRTRLDNCTTLADFYYLTRDATDVINNLTDVLNYLATLPLLPQNA
jgi:hypothetical protein